jgi:endoglucanase
MIPRDFTRKLFGGFVAGVIALGCVGSSLYAAGATSAYLRVNQIGYEVGTSMQAYLMTSAAVSGVSFAVKNSSGATSASGTAGASLGTWGSYTVYPIAFTLSKADTYTISVSGPVTATSPKFPVDTPSNLYSQALVNNLSFYENERDGPNYIASPLRTAAGHLNDAKATVYSTPSFNSNDLILGTLSSTGTTINAEGGWWDAGDYLKFVHTHSYVAALMLIGVRDFPNQMGSGSANSNFTNEAKFGLDWLQEMWNDSTKTLYYQVGIGTDFKSHSSWLSDHDLWRLPQADDSYTGTNYQYISHRPVFVAGAAGSQISPNLAGRLAADFAECFQVFQASNPTYANQCLLSAEHIFDLANTSPSGNLLTVAPWDFYPEVEWRDDLELGATELYFALEKGNLPSGLPHTDPSYYLTAAANWAHAYIVGPNDGTDTLNLYDVSALAHFELYRAITLAGNPGGLAVTQSALLSDLLKQITMGTEQAASDPFGFAEPWKDSDTISYGAGFSVMAQEYDYLASSTTYANDARAWLGNISGANAWGVAFTIGEGSTFPDCPQHQVANLAGSLNGGSPVLSGAVVEGPTSASSSGKLTGMLTCPTGGGDAYKAFNGNSAVYKDNVQSYTTDEPAIDLTALSFLMYSWRIAGAPAGTP